MPPKNHNERTELNQKIRNQIELTQEHIEAFNNLPDDSKIQSLIMRESSGSIKSIRKGLIQIIALIVHRKGYPDFDVWKTLFEEIIKLGRDFASKIKENGSLPDVSIAVAQLSAWLKVVDDLLKLVIRGDNKIDCSIYQLMLIYLFDSPKVKGVQFAFPERASEIFGTMIFKPLMYFSLKYRDKCSCIPERAFVHSSLVKKNKNILLNILTYLHEQKSISPAAASDVVEWFLLGKGNEPSLMDAPDFGFIYSNKARDIEDAKKSGQKIHAEPEIKYDDDEIEEGLWSDDGNRILATLIQYKHDSLLLSLKEKYQFELRDEDLIFICDSIGIKRFDDIDDRVFNLLIQLKNNSEPEREAIEAFKKAFEEIFNHHLDEQREIKRKSEERAMASFLPEVSHSKKSKSGKKRGRNQKKRGKKKKKQNEQTVVSVQETSETLSLTKNSQNIEERPDVKTENAEIKPESLDVMTESSEAEIEALSRTLETFCSNNGYGKFGLSDKLERVLTGLDVFFPVSGKRDRSERTHPVKTISKVISNAKEIEKKMDQLLRYNPYSNLSDSFANQSVNIPDELLALTKDCAKIVIFCEVIKSWSESVEKNFDNKRFERLSIEGWRQWKRNVFLKYFVANKIKDFIRKKFPQIIYDNEKQCYQIVSNALSDNVLAIFNKLLEDRGMFGRYLSDLRQKGNKVRVNTPRFKHDEKSHAQSSNQAFGKLCAQLCINNKDKKIERSREILEDLIDESYTSSSKVFDMERMSELDFSDQLIAGFILLSPGQVSLPKAFRSLKEHQIYSDPKAIKMGRLPHIPFIKPPENYPVQSLPNSLSENIRFKDPGDWSYHPVLAKLPQSWFKDNRTFYLGGGFAGLLSLRADLEQVKAYWVLKGDIDLLCIGDMTDILPSLRSTIFRSYPGQYTLNLLEYPWSLDDEFMVSVDLVHITSKFEEDVSPSELIRTYKENSSISIVESVVYELSANGYYRSFYGNEEELKRQVMEKSIELVNRESLRQVIDEIKKGRENRDSWKNKNKNDPARDALPGMDDLGLSFLKFFKTVIKLSFLKKWKEIFSIGPYSQKLIIENHKQIVFIIRNISPERKQSFLQNMFEMPKDFVYRYLQLLLEQRLFYAFFYINPQSLGRDKGNEISKYNKMAENIEQWFGLYTDKNSERLHNQTTVFLIMENYFKSPSQVSFSSFDFLKSMAEGCHQHVYKRSYQEVSRNKSSEPTLVEYNLFRSRVNEFRRDFDNEKQQFLQILLNPKNNISSSTCAVFPLQKNNLISSAKKCYEPSEIEIKDVETVPLLAKQLCKEIMHELYAQVIEKLRDDLSMEEMLVSNFVLNVDHETFSVNLNKKKPDRSHKSEISDDNHTFVVFFVQRSDGWHTFLSVFEEETNEGDMRVKASREAVSFMKKFDSGKELFYCAVAPYLGALYEWSACQHIENATVKIPLLERLLKRKNNQLFSSGKEDYKPDDSIHLPISPSLTQEQSAFIQQAFQRISGEENLPSILMGPPGTGKTRTFRELVFTIEKHSDIFAQSIILAHSKSVVKQVGCGFASSDEPITAAHVTDKSELDGKDSNPYPSLDALLGKSKGNGKSGGWISRQLVAIKESKSSDINEEVQKIHTLQQKVRQLIPVFAHQINAVLNVLIKQLVSEACDRGNRREEIFKENDKKIQSLLWNNSYYKAAILATSQVVVLTLHGAYNSSLRLALALRQEILPNERRLVFVEEASRAPLSSLFPALVRCMSDVYDKGVHSQEKEHLIIGGDLLQLGSVTHGQLTRSSVLRWFSECKGSWFQLHSCFRTGPKGVKRFSELGYQGSLQSGHHDGFFEQRSRALTLTDKVPYLKAPFMFIDAEGHEERENHSYLNKKEIDISLRLILDTIDATAQSDDATLKKIAIIAMYKAQAKHMKQALRKLELSDEKMKYIKCGTVDEFQGDEASIVFVSLVRTRDCGHILHIERLIVALSRAVLATVIIGNQALLERNAQMIMTTVGQNPMETAFQNRQEGLFIKRCEPDDETVLCLLKGHEGRSFWCRLSQKNRQDSTIQVEVLLEEQRSDVNPPESPNFFAALKQQKEVMYDFELSSFSLEQIKQEQSDVLKKLTLLLLNRMASRMPTPYITSRANLALVYQYVKQAPETIISAESLYSTMRNS